MAERIQRKRTKGWRMPPNTVYVGRPGKFGNPYLTWLRTKEEAIEAYRMGVEGRWDELQRWQAHGFAWMEYHVIPWFKRIRESLPELRGKNLACWCPLDQPCHADVLLELANGDSDG